MLQKRQIAISSPQKLLETLKQIAIQLRQFDIWSYREPLEIQDSSTGDYIDRPDLFDRSLSEADVEEQEFLEFLHQQLRSVLMQAIETTIDRTISKLKASKRYASFASQFVPGLQLY